MSNPASAPWLSISRTRPLAIALWSVLISLFTCFASTAQQWAGLNHPDSEFYATLGVYGSEVTDRAAEPAYYWTRLGYIAPVRALTSIFGTWVGLSIYKVILVAIISAAMLWTLARLTRRPAALLITLTIVLNTVLLSFLGNTYVTGTVLAATFAFLALGIALACTRERARWVALASGAIAAWLAMLNPYGFLLACAVWAAVRIVAIFPLARASLGALLRDLSFAVLGFAVTFLAYLGIGRLLFPGFDWLQTYRDWNARLDQSDYVGTANIWTLDGSLLIPYSAIMIALVAVILTRGQRMMVIALVIGAVNVGFAYAYFLIQGGPVVESTYYSAMLWPGALMSCAVVGGYLFGSSRWPAWPYAVAGVGVFLVIWAGHRVDSISLGQARVIASCLVLALVVALLIVNRLNPSFRIGVALIAVIGFALTAQVLQNGRGELGIFSQYPFSNAYQENSASDELHAGADIEAWVISQTSPEDRLLVWTESDRVLASPAAWQLWGENLVSLESRIAPDEIEALNARQPTALVLYGKTKESVLTFWSSLPASISATAPDCRPFAWPSAPDAQACLTRLSW